MTASWKEKSALVWGATPAGSAHAPDTARRTKEFFERVVECRNGREIRWLRELVPFAACRGKRVLEVGCGAGYDAWEFCRHGADYTGIDLTPENPPLTRRHLALFGFAPPVLRGDAEALPFRDNSFDVYFSNGVLHHTPDLPACLAEARRVLAPGGRLMVAVYHRDSIFYWLSLALTEQLLKLGVLRRTLRQRLAMIEYTTSGVTPLVNVYGRRGLRRLARQAGFAVLSLKARKLLHEDLPNIPVLRRLWPAIPERWLDATGRVFGWYLILHATKEEERTCAGS